PALDQDQGALIPEGQVGEDAGDRPAGVERAGQLAVAQAVDEGAQARALVVVVGDVRRGHAHLPRVAASVRLVDYRRPPRLTTRGASANSSRHQREAHAWSSEISARRVSGSRRSGSAAATSAG